MTQPPYSLRGADISMELSKGTNHVITDDNIIPNRLLSINYLRIDNLVDTPNTITITSLEKRTRRNNSIFENVVAKKGITFYDEIRKYGGGSKEGIPAYLESIETPAENAAYNTITEVIERIIYKCVIKPYDCIELKNGDNNIIETKHCLDVSCNSNAFIYIVPYWR